jgi:hypothetical protein
MDLLTPGLFARQAVQSLQGIIAESCGVAAVVLNLLMYPLCDHQLYAAAHAGVNSLIFTAVGLPISTWRRCQALENMRGLPPAHRKVGCTPDWQPVAAMAESALTSFGKALDNWLNAMAVVVNERVSGVNINARIAVSEGCLWLGHKKKPRLCDNCGDFPVCIPNFTMSR